MTARFYVGPGVLVFDRRNGSTVAECRTHEWAELIADGLNMIVDQVTPWSPSSRYADVLDGEVVEQPQSRALPGPVDPAAAVRRRALNMDLGARVAWHSDGMLR
jgi:hypothetical protein